MSDIATTSEATKPSVNIDHDDHAHPTETQYWLVFVALAIITAIEVAWTYLDFSGPQLVVPLLIMMVVKFIIVAGVFMHLYFDMKMLNGKLFSMTFIAGIILAMAVYTAVIATYEFGV